MSESCDQKRGSITYNSDSSKFNQLQVIPIGPQPGGRPPAKILAMRNVTSLMFTSSLLFASPADSEVI
ncbi:MAG: hypothetical protein IH914_03530 [candidate division Zixibacteria bacterium]|nr:hypothetical protein [candidate division Zixibacteria bacterium]